MAQDAGPPRLISPWVFVDTQAFIKQRFDWHGPVMEGLARIAKGGQIHLLTTSITKREVLDHIDEEVEKLAPTVKKNAGLLRAAGVDTSNLGSTDSWKISARAAFDNFLVETHARELPLSADVQGLFDAYFDRQPPFSAKKKSEFPDAVIITTLIRFHTSRAGAQIYIVTADPDFKAACAHHRAFIHVETVSDLVSLATASLALHAAIGKAIRESEDLRQQLANALLHMPASTPVEERSNYRPGSLTADGSVTKARVAEILMIQVLDVEDEEIIVELTFRAVVTMDLLVEDLRHGQTSADATRMKIEQDEIFTAFANANFYQNDPKAFEVTSVEVQESFVRLIDEEVAAFLD